MTNPTTERQWKITAEIDSALCIGDSGASETGIDKATVKTSDGKLYIPASTFKGIWRHACEAIAGTQNNQICNSPRAEIMCVKNHCTICQIFGSPTLESRIFISDLTPVSDLGTQSTVKRSGVTINRNRKVAEDGRLYFTETSIPNAGFEFSGDVTLGKAISDEQIELLSAGLEYIHAIGSGKTHGLGWLTITKTETTPNKKEFQSIETDSEDFTELAIEVTLKSPMITGGRKPSGQPVEGVLYIRGGLIRGAVAKVLLSDSESSEPDDDFKQLFQNNDAAIFRNCNPGKSVLPATAIGCKDYPGFPAKDGEEKHGISDTLFQRLVVEKAGFPYQTGCPHCDDGHGRVEAQSGFYTKTDGCYEKKALATRLLTRVAINRHRKVAEEGLLYHLNAIDPVIVKKSKKNSQKDVESEPVIVHGSARVPTALVDKVAKTLQQKVQHLGGGSSRGLGRVSVKVKRRDDLESLEQRIGDFNGELEKVWNTYSLLPHVDIGDFEGRYFSIMLQSDAILEQNWQRTMVLTAQMLQDMTACNAEVSFVRSFASYGYTGGWNAAWGLPKETELITNIGSVFVFHTSDIDAWLSALQNLEYTGIGNRREEGYGQITICDPFHLQTRDKIKYEEESA